MSRPVLLGAALAVSAAAGYLARSELDRRLRERRPPRPGLAVALGPNAWTLGQLGAIFHRMNDADRMTALTVLVDTPDGEEALYTSSEHSGPHKLVRTPVSTPYGTCERYVVMPPTPDNAAGLEGA